jgi:hypothetical protein
MATPIISDFPHVAKRPRKQHSLNDCANPIRRLAAAVVLRAVDDLLYPNAQTPPDARETAKEFLDSDIGNDLLADLLGRG